MASRGATARYPIRTAARLCGLTTDTLRVWERRYRAVQPVRSNGGARYYTESELQRLTLLRRAVDSGHSIRQVATLADGELRRLVGGPAQAGIAPNGAPAPAAAEPGQGPIAAARERFLAAIDTLDLPGAQAELERVAAFATPHELATEMVAPIMQAAGERWSAGTWRIAHVHSCSAASRTVLGTLIGLYGRQASGPTLLCCALNGEFYEIDVLLSALLAAAQRWRVVYLGPSIPAEDLVSVAATLEPRAVAVGLAWPESTEALAETVTYLRHELAAEVELWLGGSGASRVDFKLPARTRRVDNLGELDELLQNL
jgi:DNA-binding transcriptional MerR regulator